MGGTTISSEEFNRNVVRSKRAQDGPVFITDQGVPTHVLLTFETYEQLPGIIEQKRMLANVAP